MKIHLNVLALCALCAANAASAATSLQLLPAGSHDQVPHSLATPARAKALSIGSARNGITLDRTPVQFARALPADRALDATPTPYRAQSREFWSQVGQSELHAGIRVTTTAPGALIRFSPQGGTGAALDPAAITIHANGRVFTANAASSAVADAKALRDAGMAVSDGTLAFRLAPAVGSGEIQLSTAQAQGRYLVHVLDAGSPLVLGFGADRDNVLVGSAITFHAGMSDAGKPHRMALASGLVTAPDGYSADLQFSRDANGGFSATFTPDAAHAVGPQLWEAHVFSATHSNGLVVLRDAKTAFAVSAPTARFGSDVQLDEDATGMRLSLSVDAAQSSRYQVSAVLYGTGADGALHPAAMGQSAQWLEAGAGHINLRFDATSLDADGLHAPYELRDLRLIDQANMSVIERRGRALAVD